MSASTDTGSSDADGLTNLRTVIVQTEAFLNSTVVVLLGDMVIAQAAANGPVTVPVELPGSGTHRLRVAVEDEAGNRTFAPAELEVTLDLVGPATLTAIAETTVTGATIRGTADAGAIVRLFRGTTTILAIRTTVADATGAYRFDDVPAAAPGSVFAVTASDHAGNFTTTDVTVTTTTTTTATDTAGPILSVALDRDTGVSATDGVTANPTHVIVADDASGLSTLTLQINGGSGIDLASPWGRLQVVHSMPAA